MMRYSEIPHDFSSDSLHFAELGEDQIYRALRDDSPPSDVSIQSSGPLVAPTTTQTSIMPGSAEKKKRGDKFSLRSSNSSASDLAEVIRLARTKKNSLSGQGGGSTTTSVATPSEAYAAQIQGLCSSKKSNSLPPNASIQDLDATICSALRVSPEELASQITLLDFPVFAAIQPDELTSCAWTKKNKHITTPNIVAFTKRFNHTSFWTVQEILSEGTPKARAEVMAHFIRVAKKLLELNNLHSLFAIISAMQSASIYRLSKTWACLTKKERASFDRLAEIYNDKDNWSTLREYLESLKLPCIPYIGLFLTDLVYIDLAYPHKGGGLEPEQRTTQMNNILRVIANYQNSDYSAVIPSPQIQKYLQSVRYIEELQNIFEEDQYKQSLKLEPQPSKNGSNSMLPPSSGSCSSKESIGHASTSTSNGTGLTPQKNVDTIAIESLNLSPAKSISSMRSSSSVTASSKFIPGHRKCRSLGTKCRSTSLPRNFHQKCACTVPLMAAAATLTRTLPGNRCKCRIFKTNAQVGILAANGNGSGMGFGLGGHNGSNASSFMTSNGDLGNDSTMSHHQSRHLLDDSVLEEKSSTDLPLSPNTEIILAAVVGKDGRNGAQNGGKDAVLEFQGCIRRKTLLKEGRKPAVASWQRYWLQVWANHLVFFPPKTFKGNERTDFKREPCKVCPLDGWHVEQLEGQQHANSFQLINITTNTIYKFRTSTTNQASVWVDVLHHIITIHRSAEPGTMPVNLMSFE